MKNLLWKFKKKCIGVFVLLCGMCVNTYAITDPEVFIDNYANLLSIVLSSYRDGTKIPLDARIFDVSRPENARFLSALRGQDSVHSFLSASFFRDFDVNGTKTNFCFIAYNRREISQLDTYLNSTFTKQEDALYFLVAHEFGHCADSHWSTHSLGKTSGSLKEAELVADMFAAGLFLLQKKDDAAQKIIGLAATLKESDPHHNPDEIKKFIEDFKKNPPKINNTFELFGFVSKYIETNKVKVR